MLKRQSPTYAYDERVVGLTTRLVHGEEVGEHLRRVPLVGEAVVDRHPGVGGELLDVGLGCCRGTRSRRTCDRARGRCRPPTPCVRAASPTDRGRSRGRPDRRPPPRTPTACASRSSRRSGRSPCRPGAWLSVPEYLAILSAWESCSRNLSSCGSKSISLRKLRLRRLYISYPSDRHCDPGTAVARTATCTVNVWTRWVVRPHPDEGGSRRIADRRHAASVNGG